MITFILSLLLLAGGYLLYGKYIERVFSPDEKKITPALAHPDGVDYVPLSGRKIFLIQFLNIAGLGPIFGAIMGAMYGPVVFLWIVFGTLLAGAVHDYLSGMMSLRNEGKSLPELIAAQLGVTAGTVVRVMTIVLMVLVGAVFLSGPANLLTTMTGGVLSVNMWIALIFAYYILATLFPVDKIIGRIYPVFGFALLFMAVGIFAAILWHRAPVPELFGNFANLNPNPDKFPVFPMLFITVACGAISGFHATQSPLMARCIKSEKEGRKVFFGAMVAEGMVATIWAAAGMCFFGGMEGFQGFMAENGNSAALVVDRISSGWLGKLGGFLALLGVVAAPITSADTAFRSARLIIADFLKVDQKSFRNRIFISAPLFVACFILLTVNFDIIWRYFAWCNQTLAVFTLWSITVYLAARGKNYFVSLVPAVFMSAVTISYILMAPEGFAIDPTIAYLAGIPLGLLPGAWFLLTRSMKFKSLFTLLLLLSCAAVQAQTQTETPKYTTFYYQRASLFEVLPTSPEDIIFLGNSLTNGAEWSELFNNPNIKNRGISGDSTDGICDRLDVILKGKPAKIFFLCGVNDLANGKSPEYIASNIARIVERVKAESPRTRLYIQSVLPFNDTFKRWKNLDGKEELLQETNRLVEEVCRKEEVPFIEIGSLFSDEEGKLSRKYTNDGLHLTGEGYLLWKKQLEPYL